MTTFNRLVGMSSCGFSSVIPSKTPSVLNNRQQGRLCVVEKTETDSINTAIYCDVIPFFCSSTLILVKALCTTRLARLGEIPNC